MIFLVVLVCNEIGSDRHLMVTRIEIVDIRPPIAALYNDAIALNHGKANG